MDRLLNIAGFGILACILAAIGLNQFNDPFKSERNALEQRLAEGGPIEEKEDAFEWQFDEWKSKILNKQSAWRELVPPPPPAPPPPPPPPEQPDLAQMLADVKATRQQVGDKVKFTVPDNPRGEFKAAGDSINGVTIKSITRTEVLFSYEWKEMNKELTYTMARQ